MECWENRKEESNRQMILRHASPNYFHLYLWTSDSICGLCELYWLHFKICIYLYQDDEVHMNSGSCLDYKHVDCMHCGRNILIVSTAVQRIPQDPAHWELTNYVMTFLSILVLACLHSKGVVAGIEAKTNIHKGMMHFSSFCPWMSVEGEHGHKRDECSNQICEKHRGVRKDLFSN